jgi:hypothetical protein
MIQISQASAPKEAMNTAMAIVRTDLICEGSSARVDRHVESEMTVRHRTLVAIELGRPYVDHPILLPRQGLIQ